MAEGVTICECFARDGLQHESGFVPTSTKLKLLRLFGAVGFARVEATAYSNPARIPAFSDASAVLAGAIRHDGVSYKATCPNLRAVQRAVADFDDGHGADELSLLVSATESHSMRNLRVTRQQQWDNVAAMVDAAGGRFRLVGVVSVAFGCPFEGSVDPRVVHSDVARFVALGVDFVTLGDTTGLGTPRTVGALFQQLGREHPDVQLVAHLHNTRGTGLANAVAALDAGCRHFDSSMGGTGGHPAQISYGTGETGNVCTEDLAHMFEAMGVRTGLDLDRLMAASHACEQALGRQLSSMVARTVGFGDAGR